MAALYQLTGALLELRQRMAEDGLDEQTIADTIEGESLDFDQKVVGCMMVCDELEGDIATIDAHIKRLQERKKRIAGNRDALKARAMASMKAIGRHRIPTPLMTVTLYPGRDEAVEILDADALPVSCLKLIPASSEPIKPEVRKYLKSLSDEAAALFTGARLVKSDRLEIKV